jgi:hypothetical protein
VRVDDEKTQKKWGRLDRLQLSATILARWQRLVASNKALNLLYWAMRAVLYRRTATAFKMASLLGTFFVVVLFAVALAAAGAIRSK